MTLTFIITENGLEEVKSNPVPSEVQNHQFGCNNCLWASAECKQGSKYVPGTAKKPCQSYTYFD